jgi:hypothetical protein
LQKRNTSLCEARIGQSSKQAGADSLGLNVVRHPASEVVAPQGNAGWYMVKYWREFNRFASSCSGRHRASNRREYRFECSSKRKGWLRFDGTAASSKVNRIDTN